MKEVAVVLRRHVSTDDRGGCQRGKNIFEIKLYSSIRYIGWTSKLNTARKGTPIP